MRISNNTIVRNYTRNLGNSLRSMNTASEKITGRRFNSMYENTSNGIRAMQVRRSLENAQSYIDTAKTVNSQFASAESQMIYVNELGQAIAEKYTSALNTGTNGEDEFKIFANEIKQLRDQILNCANGQFADRYMFGGSNTTTQPFTVHPSSGNLLYNGKDVTKMADSNGNLKPEYQYLMDDAVFVDIGKGLKNGPDGALVESSAFKSSLNGLEFLGIGEDNIYQVCNEIISALESGSFTNNDYTAGLLDKMTNAYKNVTLKVTQLGSDTQYLDFSIDRFESDMITLYERQDELEFMDPAEAILQFKMEEYAYNASLQMGQRILQPNLFSFMN